MRTRLTCRLRLGFARVSTTRARRRSSTPGSLTTGKKSQRVASGRVRLARITDCSALTLNAFVAEVAAPGSLIHTDAWGGYNQLAQLGFAHEVINQSASGDPAHVTMPHVHRVASLLKRWLLGTHQGGGKPRQLDAYLDEFVFRFNRRTSASRGLLFYRLLEQAVQLEHVTGDTITAERNPRRPPDLLKVIAEAAGDEVIVKSFDRPVAKLVPYASAGTERKPGLLAGQITIKPGFEAFAG